MFGPQLFQFGLLLRQFGVELVEFAFLFALERIEQIARSERLDSVLIDLAGDICE